MNQISPKRAVTDEQKFRRRQEILEAADRHFFEVGFEAFSMAKLAKLAGVAKGTLYLYFETREEVFLALYIQKIEGWSVDFVERLNNKLSDDEFVTEFFESGHFDKNFIPLLLRMDHIIEHNVSIASLIASKRALGVVFDRVASIIAETIDLTRDQAMDTLRSFASLLMGAARIDQAPSLEEEELPEDVRALIDSFETKDTFVKNARRILAGIRAGIK